MANDKFKQKMAALEKERDEFISRLTPEEQQEFKQKQKEYNQQEDIGNIRFAITPDTDERGKNNLG